MPLARKRKMLPLRERLIQSVAAHIAKRPGCMIAMDVGNAMLVLVQRKFTSVEVINPEGFTPHTKQADVQIPVPVMLLFDTSAAVDRKMLARFHALGGESIVVKSLTDATEALDHG